MSRKLSQPYGTVNVKGTTKLVDECSPGARGPAQPGTWQSTAVALADGLPEAAGVEVGEGLGAAEGPGATDGPGAATSPLA